MEHAALLIVNVVENKLCFTENVIYFCKQINRIYLFISF